MLLETITLSPVHQAELPFVRQIYASTRQEELNITSWTEDQRAAFIEMQFKAQNQHYWTHYPESTHDLIWSGEQPVGRLWVDRSNPGRIHILDIAIQTEARGMGIGTYLLQQLQAEAQASGRSLSLHVWPEDRALHLYQRLGFVQVGEEMGYCRMEWRPAGPKA